MPTTPTVPKRHPKVVTPINATITGHTGVKARKADGSPYVTYFLRCADGCKRAKSLDADNFYPVGTTLQLVPYWDAKGKEHHQLINVQSPQQGRYQSNLEAEADIDRF